MPPQVRRGIYCIAFSRHRHYAFIKNAPLACFLLWRRRRDFLARHKCAGCGATVTICPHWRLANLLVVEPAICDCDVFAPFRFTGNNKMPPRGILLFLAVQETFYLWLMKDLRPSHNQNGQKQGKTGNFCKKWHFGAIFYTTYDRTRPQICGVFTLSAPKFPTKITGNFSEHIRDFPANIRDYF